MANGYDQRQGGYGSSGGGYRSNYRYQQPIAFQHKSFFEPIPIEFLQQQFDRRQQAYDASIAGALAARQQAMEAPVALDDTFRRNQLINQSMESMQKTVDEKFGGDWGKARKDVARKITDIRADPFWKRSEYVAQQQKVQQAFELQNPDAHIYTDVIGKGAYDPDKERLRTTEELTFEGGKRGNYPPVARMLISDIRASITPIELRNAGLTDEAINDFYKYGTRTELTDKMIRDKIGLGDSENNAIAKSFLESVPDYGESRRRLGDMTEEEIIKEAKNYVYGFAAGKPYSEERLSYTGGSKITSSGTSTVAGGYNLGVGSEAISIVNQTELGKGKVTRDVAKSRKELLALRKSFADDPENPTLAAKEKEYEDMTNERNLVMENVKSSEFAPITTGLYDDYVNDFFVTKELKQEFEQKQGRPAKPLTREDREILIGMAEDQGLVITPEKFNTYAYQMTSEGLSLDEIQKELELTNTRFAPLEKKLKKAAKEVRRSLDNYSEKHGVISQDVQILGGEVGSKDLTTPAGRINETLTTMFRTTSGNWVTAGTGMQFNTAVQEKYDGRVDKEKSWASVTDGTFNGKVAISVDLRDEDGNHLGNEILVQELDDGGIRGTMIRVAQDMFNSGDPTAQDMAGNIISNYTYGSMIEDADLYRKAKGEVPGATFHGHPLLFEKVFHSDKKDNHWLLYYNDVNEAGEPFKNYVRDKVLNDQGEVVGENNIKMFTPKQMQSIVGQLALIELKQQESNQNP